MLVARCVRARMRGPPPTCLRRGLRRRPRHASATPDAQPKGKQPEDERPRGSVAPRI
eukprot:gene10972-biopygen5276